MQHCPIAAFTRLTQNVNYAKSAPQTQILTTNVNKIF